MLYFIIQVYYMGRWRLDAGIFKRIFLVCYNDSRSLCSGNRRALKPLYPYRMFLLVVMNAANWGLDSYGIYHNNIYSSSGHFCHVLLFQEAERKNLLSGHSIGQISRLEFET